MAPADVAVTSWRRRGQKPPNVLRRTATYYDILRRTTTSYDALRRSTAYYDVLHLWDGGAKRTLMTGEHIFNTHFMCAWLWVDCGELIGTLTSGLTSGDTLKRDVASY